MLQIEVIEDLATEPVTLQEAKDFLNIDFADWDTLLTMLITASRQESERVTGKAYGAKVIQVTGNTQTDQEGNVEKIYPITPFVSDEDWVDEDENTDYRYNAGYTTLPIDLKVAILQRVATGYAYRENGFEAAMNEAVNASINKELKVRTSFIA